MVAALSVPSVFAQQTGTLKVQFKYGGSAFDPAAIDVNKDKEFCGKHPLVSERLLVDKTTNGIKNVVLHVYTGARRLKSAGNETRSKKSNIGE